MAVDCVLRDAAINGDERAFLQLLQNGEDASGVIGPLILGAPSFEDLDSCRSRDSAPGRLSILSFLLENHCLSLYTLNASHTSLKGLTPLGMATYLNRLDFVTVLLEKGDGLVLVDGLDSQRATPIMYAARDGYNDVLQYLIRQGAMIGSVDCYRHSVPFYATSAPQCLWTCELNLRFKRIQSLLSHGKKRKLRLTLQLDVSDYNALTCLYQQHHTYPLSSSVLRSSVRRLVTSISSSDLSTVQSLLFPSQASQVPNVPVPILVNHPDENGWSPIHYCVTSARPSISILDALYLAGADLTLYTPDNTMSPLHVLARFGGTSNTGSFRLYAFIVHLVRDLGAPLDAVDQQGETCIHVAARYGRNADILMAFLECDTDGSVAKFKNNEGQTAFDVAKPEFRSVFEQDEASIRPGSAASLRTIKPSFSSSSLTTTYSSGSSSSLGSCQDEEEQVQQFPPPMSREKENLRAALITPDEAQQISENLECVADQLQKIRMKNGDQIHPHNMQKGKSKEPADLDDVEELLQFTRQTGSELLERFRHLIDFELDDLHVAKEVHASLEELILRLEERALIEQEEERAATPSLTNRRSSATPSLVASGSSASLASLADFAALITPTGSPRASMEDIKTPRPGKTFTTEDEELDFACALAAASVTRQRRASALNGIFSLGTIESSVSPDITLPFSDPSSPLEEGVNLVSIPPTRAPAVHESILHPQEMEATSARGTARRAKRESWLDPYVRRANSDILKEHLANLLEIEQMLFGEEDREREESPSPGSVSSADDAVSWREGVDVAELHGVDPGDWDDSEGEGTYANFLDIFGVEDGGDAAVGLEDFGAPFLDMVASGNDDEEDEESYSKRASTIKPTHRESMYACGPPSALDILRVARRELYAVEEAMLTACRSIETAQRYISEVESLMGEIFEKMDHAVQASRLTSALSDIHSSDVAVSPHLRSRSDSVSSVDTYYGPAPASSPVKQRLRGAFGRFVRTNAESRAFPLPPSGRSAVRYSREHSMVRYPSIQSLLSLPSASSASSPNKSPASLELVPLPMEDMRSLRRLLVRKVPLWLDATAYDVDKASAWVGVVQSVVRNVQRTRMT